MRIGSRVSAAVPNSSDGLRFFLAASTACPLFAFAFWTIATLMAVIANLNFQTLAHVGPWVLVAGVGCALFAAKSQRSAIGPEPAHPEPANGLEQSTNCKLVAAAAVLVSVIALGLGSGPLWLGS